MFPVGEIFHEFPNYVLMEAFVKTKNKGNRYGSILLAQSPGSEFQHCDRNMQPKCSELAVPTVPTYELEDQALPAPLPEKVAATA